MQTIEVTDEQYAVIQRLREEISEQVVGKYGHVRERDAIQFLVDNLEGAVDSGGDDAAFDPSAALAAADDAESGDWDEVEVEAIEEAVDEGDGGEAITYEEDGDEETSDDAGEAEGNADAADDSEAAGGGGSGATADDDDKLDKMMNLLETHDDKWEESPSADYRYRVTLPDGTTEDVQTKDDVRALLFKNY